MTMMNHTRRIRRQRMLVFLLLLWGLSTGSPSFAQSAPTLLSPPDGAMNQPVTPTLAWNSVLSASSYHLQVATDSIFTAMVFTDSTVSNTSQQVGPLGTLTTYYWRVRAKSLTSTGDWSSVWRFTTVPGPPQAPALSSPPDGAIDQPITPTLSWTAVSDADTYHLQLSTDISFSAPSVNDSTVTDVSKQAGPLAHNTLYYWRVRAKNAGGVSPWSSVWGFTTITEAPTATTKPATNVTTTSATLNGVVDPNGLSTTAKFQYGTTTSYGSSVDATQSPVTGPDSVAVSNTLNGLTPNTTYHYRVSAVNTAGSAVGGDQTFTTATPASPPTATTKPATDVTTTSATLNGVVNPNGLSTTVKFQYGTTTSYGAETTAAQSPINGTDTVSVSSPLSGLTSNTTYHYRVTAANSAGAANGMNGSFTTNAAQPGTSPSPVSPSDGAMNQPTTLTLSWTAVSGALTYHLQVSTGSAFTTTVVNDSTLTGTSRQVGSLNNNTTYYWRVRAKSLTSTGDWSSVWRFTTAPSPPATPVLSGPADNATGQPTTLTLSWTAVTGADTYHLQVSTNSSFTTTVVNDAALTGTSRQVGPLNKNTTYYWWVRAQNGGGASAWSNVWRFTTSNTNTPVVATRVATGVDSISATLNGLVNPNGLSTTVKFQYGTTTAYGSEISAIQNPVNGTDSVAVSGPLSGLTPGAVYHYRVTAANSDGSTNGEDMTFTTLWASYPTTLSLKTTILFSKDVFNVKNYRLVGLPGVSDQSADQIIPGIPGKEWRLFWDNGAPENYFVEYNGSAVFRFASGRAFWLIKNGPWDIDVTTASAPLDSSGHATVPLHDGWNLITNPFPSSMPWAAVQNANNITDPIYVYKEGFDLSTLFDPYEGYYLFNTTGITSLKVPLGRGASKTVAAKEIAPAGWKVNVALSSGASLDRITWFGVSPHADDALDPLDIRKPRGIAGSSSVYFNRPQWDAEYHTFATDIRTPIDKIGQWDFEVFSERNTSFDLIFSGMENLPADFEIYLVDAQKTTSGDLRKQNRYHITPQSESSQYRVVVGQHDAVQEKLAVLLRPTVFSLGENHPNPFNPSTAIPVALPIRTEIALRVFNILGQEVKTLYAGVLDAGNYVFHWNGQNNRGAPLSSGIYLYRLTTGAGRTFTRKMVLLK